MSGRWILLLLITMLSRPALAEHTYWQLDIKGPIGSGTADFIVSELAQAQPPSQTSNPSSNTATNNSNINGKPESPAFVLLTLDTPGGLYEATRNIISAMLASSIPVVVYVAPSGARAASAGTYILYASHVAAMAPGTHVGAATPVQLSSQLRPNAYAQASPYVQTSTYVQANTYVQAKAIEKGTDQVSADAQTQADMAVASSPVTANPAESPTHINEASNESASERKTINDAVAYLRSLAQLRGRNVEWAELAVRQAATLTASEALTEQVIDLIADDVPALLTALNDRRLTINGHPYTFATLASSSAPSSVSADHNANSGAELKGQVKKELKKELRQPNWRQQFIITITNPNITYLLLLVGVYGLLLEFMSPGFGVAGVSGAICLLLAATALHMLPFSAVGLALLALGLMFMVAEAITPTLGLLGLGGVVTFVIGSLLLFNTPDNAFRIAWPLIASFALISLVLMLVVIRMILKQRHRPAVSGVEAMVGLQGETLSDIAPTGYVMVQGERWQAHSAEPIAARQAIVVMAAHDLLLEVRPLT